MIVSIIASVIGGFSWGQVMHRNGPKRTHDRVPYLWVATLFLTMAIPMFGLPKELFWLVGAMFGVALGGTWASDRPYMLLLSPPAKVGEFYGIYSMIGRFAAVIGPLVWAFIAETLGLGRPAAVAGLLV